MLSHFQEDEIDAQLYEHYVSLMHSPTSYVLDFPPSTLADYSRSQAVGVQPPTPSYMTYLWKDGSTLRNATLLESRTTIESGTTGLRTWLASLVLAQSLITTPGMLYRQDCLRLLIIVSPELVQQTRVLELGSGVGFLGIVAATLQVSHGHTRGTLTLTDVNDEVLVTCGKNSSLPCSTYFAPFV